MENDVKKFLEEELKKLEKAIEAKDANFDELMKKAIKQADENADEKGKKISDDLKKTVEDEIKSRSELQKQVDLISVNMGKISETQISERKSFMGQMLSDLTKDEGFKKYQSLKKGAFLYEPKGGSFFPGIYTKADAMVPASNLSGQVTPVMRMPGIMYDPDRPEHIRDLMNVIPTTSDTIYYITETMDTDGTQVTAPGAAKGQSELTLTNNTVNVRKITTYLEIADEMLNDIPGMTAYLTARFTGKLKIKEDQQILYGTNLSNQLQGITPLAQAYDGDAISVTAITRIDVIRAAIAQARTDEYKATAVILNPTDVLLIDLLKSSTYEYIHNGIWGQRPNIGGVYLLETTAITAGDFLVGDFRLGATLWDRQQATVKFSDSHGDNFVKNIVTVVFEERIAQTVERPNAFVYGSFTSALACGSAAA